MEAVANRLILYHYVELVLRQELQYRCWCACGVNWVMN